MSALYSSRVRRDDHIAELVRSIGGGTYRHGLRVTEREVFANVALLECHIRDLRELGRGMVREARGCRAAVAQSLRNARARRDWWLAQLRPTSPAAAA